MANITRVWPVGDGASPSNQPFAAVLGERRQLDLRNFGADVAEQGADVLPEGVRTDRDGEGDEHDQQGIFGRRGAPFIPSKTIDQPAHIVLLRKLVGTTSLRLAAARP